MEISNSEREEGRSSLIYRYITGQFPHNYIPTTLNPCDVNVDVAGRAVKLTIVDGHDDGEPHLMRTQQYRTADVVAICFGLDHERSLWHIESRIIEEVRELGRRDLPIIVVGCKTDIRGEVQRKLTDGNIGKTIVQSADITYALQRIGAALYVECSSLDNAGVDEVFQHAARLALYPPQVPPNKRECVVC
ncbi:probable GTPase Rho1 [Serendipita indica DSM 11827]|uniref:Probable GTPase Rho1 n=1 Tax=Serendipita indica (strain DSM 11827) TaxID=1109443 RepID=G4TTN0_SERID|nr:probable GTPase Rho1 [Serendipita indica DSM 11827]